MISFSGAIYNNFKIKQINFVGALVPPYPPPTYSILIASSTNDSAVNPVQNSFQYLQLYILFLKILSIKNYGFVPLTYKAPVSVLLAIK